MPSVIPGLTRNPGFSGFMLQFIPAQGAGAGMTRCALINVTMYNKIHTDKEIQDLYK